MNIAITEAKKLVDEIVRRAEAGEHIVLTSNGQKIAEVGPASDVKPTKSLLGALKGKVWMA